MEKVEIFYIYYIVQSLKFTLRYSRAKYVFYLIYLTNTFSVLVVIAFRYYIFFCYKATFTDIYTRVYIGI